MNEKYPKTFRKHCNQCFYIVKGLVNGLELFWQQHIFSKFFYVNHNIIMWWKFSRFFKIFKNTFVQNISRIFLNKHRINSHPRGWIEFMISFLHPVVKGRKEVNKWAKNMSIKKIESLTMIFLPLHINSNFCFHHGTKPKHFALLQSFFFTIFFPSFLVVFPRTPDPPPLFFMKL
jgi:hypothetical protein